MSVEKEPLPNKEKLVAAIAADYPTASEILIQFPEEWVFTAYLPGDPPLYVGGWCQEEPVRSDHFYDLPRQVNENLNRYTFYKFFQPQLTPSLLIAWKEAESRGQVIGFQGAKIQMWPVGQAQVWHGDTYAVLWECYFFSTGRERSGWESRLEEIWRKVEEDVGAKVFYTHSQEPAWPEGRTSYQSFLSRLGYAPSEASPGWWSKGKSHMGA